MSHRLALAPTGRAGCKHCSKPIARGTLRVTDAFPADEFDGDLEFHYHARCVLGFNPMALHELLRGFGDAFPDREALTEELAPWVRRLDRGPRAHTLRDEDFSVLHDGAGRPHARILCGQLPKTKEFVVLLRSVTEARTTQKRAYQLVSPRVDLRYVGLDDATVPILGTVLAVPDHGELLEAVLPRLSVWRQRRLPPPVLWILGKHRRTDALEVRLRALVTQAGLSGDEAVVVASPKATADSLKKVLEALDRHLPEPAVHRDLRTPTRRALDALAELAAEERHDAMALVLATLRAGLDPGYPRAVEAYDDDTLYDYWDSKREVAVQRLQDLACEAFAVEPLGDTDVAVLARCEAVATLAAHAGAVRALFAPRETPAQRKKKKLPAKRK